MMNWNSLLSRKRLAKTTADPELPHRSAYEIDIDRITFTTSFRRLADKQQVHGIGGSDYVRSRLTHSMEAARVGRSLGMWVGPAILRSVDYEVKATPADIGHVVAAASLAHDVGTPCFAHTGEDVISDWFADSAIGQRIRAGLSDVEQAELCKFEANAQGFRVLTRLQGWRGVGGLQLTAATLGAGAKYPWGVEVPNGPLKRPHKRKYGFFGCEQDVFAEVATEVGLVEKGPGAWCRHPLAYLVEAADDACYHVVDIEDAAKMRMLSFEHAEDLLLAFIRDDKPDTATGKDWEADYKTLEDEDRKLIFLRAQAIDRLVRDAAEIFLERLPQLMAGEFCHPLLTLSARAPALRRIEQVSHERIYRGQQRCETDIIAARTITTLLDAYGEALLDREKLGPGAKLPRRWASLLETMPESRQLPYERAGWVRGLLDYVAGMTDRFAIRQAQLIAG
ncbi:dGTPase [Nitrospirillum bahiense]|uniref:dGTPase n=2 Tax=Nitrospirillum amazonense TaxID=28077 RepID=A0A560EXL9_9PROT|nr:dGTPase [Nitrospirillum amazonense]